MSQQLDPELPFHQKPREGVHDGPTSRYRRARHAPGLAIRTGADAALSDDLIEVLHPITNSEDSDSFLRRLPHRMGDTPISSIFNSDAPIETR